MSTFIPSEQLQVLFSEFGAESRHAPLSDFSRLRWGVHDFCEVAPATPHDAQAIVELSVRHGVPVRTRGNGHALNGSSLPAPGELVVQTRALNDVRLNPDHTVTVGAGVVMWDLQNLLEQSGYALPVVNDGYAGPSVGGYVAAGGFGPGSARAGGFWSNVAELLILDGHAELQRISSRDALFPWLFGSMGQLGIVVEARLNLELCASAPTLGPRTAAANGAPAHALPDEAGRLFWFTLFVMESQVETARAQLDLLETSHPGTFAFRNRYTYLIADKGVVAPLVWPRPTPCYAVGSWGILEDGSPRAIQAVLAFDECFMELALSNGYGRYIQSEIAAGPHTYQRLFGAQIYAEFRQLRQRLDPYDLLNRGYVFSIDPRMM